MMKDFRETAAALEFLEAYTDIQKRIEHWYDEEEKALDKGNEGRAARCLKRAQEAEAEAIGMDRAIACFGWTVESRIKQGGGMEYVLISMKKYLAYVDLGEE